ncbi:MAG: DUF721 domain-containing protein [Salibacteraceae bacterium]|jgi:hypothetical protein|nr:DUF721 domain-containing protein [Salibacteraceae bacterium]MDP4763997.1 DUF721 domain-containing protein [Salibacteraceae bacterium]MDP4934433.1 DUF721 domain-containing protein [Salibacteraceae bacterium]MDP4964136.1 DUF721 domain-containing protein [Salibacteraceae bacterium]
MQRKTNQESLGDVIERMLKVYRLKSGLTEIALKSDWEKIVGSVIASRTDDILLRGNKLILKINSAAMKQELHYQREGIMANVNKHLEQDLIKEVLIQ